MIVDQRGVKRNYEAKALVTKKNTSISHKCLEASCHVTPFISDVLGMLSLKVRRQATLCWTSSLCIVSIVVLHSTAWTEPSAIHLSYGQAWYCVLWMTVFRPFSIYAQLKGDIDIHEHRGLLLRAAFVLPILMWVWQLGLLTGHLGFRWSELQRDVRPLARVSLAWFSTLPVSLIATADFFEHRPKPLSIVCEDQTTLIDHTPD